MTYLGCKGPGMHRLHDEYDNVAPCPVCGLHHFGPRGKIEDSIVAVSYEGSAIWWWIKRLICRRKGHLWGRASSQALGHIQSCARCDAQRTTTSVISTRIDREV
jgi:hypothetical protein